MTPFMGMISCVVTLIILQKGGIAFFICKSGVTIGNIRLKKIGL